MRDDDVSEVAVVLDGVRFYVEARQDGTEHEVGSTLAEGLGAAMDAIKTLGSHITEAVKPIEPDHFGIQLGFEFKLEQGAGDDLSRRARPRPAGEDRGPARQVRCPGPGRADDRHGVLHAPCQVLTCRHVVAAALGRDGAPISVRWFPAGSGESVRLGATVLEAPDGNWPDIAVLAVPGKPTARA